MLRRFALLSALVLAVFAASPGSAEAGVHVQVGPQGVYVGPGYGYYHQPYYYYPRAYYYPPAYYYPRYRYYRKPYRWRKKYRRRYYRYW